MAKNKLTSKELTYRILGLKPGEQFEVQTSTQRGIASSIAKTLRMAGRIDFVLASKKTATGYVFFAIRPT